MELKILTDLSAELPAKIEGNFDELETELAVKLENYRGLVVTEDTIKGGKSDRAALNKLREAIDSERKRVKKLWNVPYLAFEDRCKKLISMVDEPIQAIDSQLRHFEDERKEKKTAEIQTLYNGLVVGELARIIPMAKVWNPKWLNATVSMNEIQKEINDLVYRTQADIQAMDVVEQEYKTAVMAVYLQTLDISQALAKRKELKQADELLHESMRKLETAPERPQEKPAEPEKLFRLKLEFSLTKTQANELKEFLLSRGIDHKRI